MMRRHLLKATLAGGTILAAPAVIVRAAAPDGPPPPPPPPAAAYHRLFPTLRPARFAPEEVRALAAAMTSEPELETGADGRPRRTADGRLLLTATPEDEQDGEENFGVPAGYTYVGQFVDHDLTFSADASFDPPSRGPGEHPPGNLRTAAFDLDNLYGRGPADQPYLYEADGRRLRRGRALTRSGTPSAAHDHPRMAGRALIGDPRNDENVLVSQLHGVFADFHNVVAGALPRLDFRDLRRTVAWHYQWMLLTDFLPRLCGPDVLAGMLPGFGEGGRVGKVRARRGVTATLPPRTMPLEFVDAAYRFGHSMVRPVYRLNTTMTGTPEEIAANSAVAGRKLIFAGVEAEGLNGLREFPDAWAIDWSLFFETRAPLALDRVGDGPARVQAAYKFDTQLVNPLAFLPEFSRTAADGRPVTDADGRPAPRGDGVPASLALRNLMRGVQRGLPSGQDVARALGLDPLPDAAIRIGKATCEDMDRSAPITAFGDGFRGQAPLWTYVLAEAQHGWTRAARASDGDDDARDALPVRLGPVGARLVAETFVALMMLDSASVLHAPSDWRPSFAHDRRFGMIELVRAAGHG